MVNIRLSQVKISDWARSDVFHKPGWTQSQLSHRANYQTLRRSPYSCYWNLYSFLSANFTANASCRNFYKLLYYHLYRYLKLAIDVAVLQYCYCCLHQAIDPGTGRHKIRRLASRRWLNDLHWKVIINALVRLQSSILINFKPLQVQVQLIDNWHV